MRFTCGRQSCLQAAFQAAVFDTRNSSGFRTAPLAVDEAEEVWLKPGAPLGMPEAYPKVRFQPIRMIAILRDAH